MESKKTICACGENSLENTLRSLRIMQNALGKATPMKPIFTEDKSFALCPCCDGKGLYDKQKFCDNCGQAIGWEE